MALSNRWQPLVEREFDGTPVREEDPRAQPLDLVLTPQERDRAKLAALHLERHRRNANLRDTLRSLGVVEAPR